MSSELSTKPLDHTMLKDLEALFRQTKATDGCWCMWYIISVRDYHAGRGAQNQRQFSDLMRESAVPMGILGYVDGKPAGWIASGPRSRFARALKTPTMHGRDPGEDTSVWLVTCFFVGREHRRKGLAGNLLDAAIEHARQAGAKAIEGFPTQGFKRASSDSQVGTEQMFAGRGFQPIRRPTTNRVIMRLNLSTS